MTHCSDQEPGLDSQLVSSTPRTAVAQASQAFGAAVIWSVLGHRALQGTA